MCQGANELNQSLLVLTTTNTIETSHHSGGHKAFRHRRCLTRTLQDEELAVQVGVQQFSGQTRVDTTQLLIQLLDSGLYFGCCSPLRLTHVQHQEGIRQTLREHVDHLKDRPEVGGLAHLHDTHIIRTTSNDRSVGSVSQGLGLGCGSRVDHEDNLRSSG